MPLKLSVATFHESLGELRGNQKTFDKFMREEAEKAELFRGDITHIFNTHAAEDTKGFEKVGALSNKVEQMIPVVALIPSLVKNVETLVTIKDRTIWTLGGVVLAIGFFKDILYKIFEQTMIHIGG